MSPMDPKFLEIHGKNTLATRRTIRDRLCDWDLALASLFQPGREARPAVCSSDAAACTEAAPLARAIPEPAARIAVGFTSRQAAGNGMERHADMEPYAATHGSPVNFGAIQALVHQGKAVVTAEDSAIVDWAFDEIQRRRTTTLYLKPKVFQAIRRRYWTPERVGAVGLEPLSAELISRIKCDFGIEIDGNANRVDCPRCGQCYGTYEFIQQGIEEHGEDIVRETFSLKRAAILQINPVQNITCRNCRLSMLSARRGRDVIIHYHYDYWCREGNAYACCNDFVLTIGSTVIA